MFVLCLDLFYFLISAQFSSDKYKGMSGMTSLKSQTFHYIDCNIAFINILGCNLLKPKFRTLSRRHFFYLGADGVYMYVSIQIINILYSV